MGTSVGPANRHAQTKTLEQRIWRASIPELETCSCCLKVKQYRGYQSMTETDTTAEKA
jgi:hypothetical protein